MRSTLAASLALATLVLGACRGDESSPAPTTTTDAGTTADNPTAIKCPFPTTPKGFVNEDSQNVLETGRLFMNEDQDA